MNGPLAYVKMCLMIHYVYAGSNPIVGSIIFLSLFLFFISIQACKELYTTYICSISRKKSPCIKSERKKLCHGSVRAFNLPIRILRRYPYTTGWERFCVEFDKTHWALKSKTYSETSFTAIYSTLCIFSSRLFTPPTFHRRSTNVPPTFWRHSIILPHWWPRLLSQTLWSAGTVSPTSAANLLFTYCF